MRSVYQVIERGRAVDGERPDPRRERAPARSWSRARCTTKSDRAKGPFFALNCAALPKEILENELFGHEKGAFTGSTNEKAGAFEMASGGTIFLDEVAEMPPDIQVKLLRAHRDAARSAGSAASGRSRSTSASSPRRTRTCRRRIVDGELREDLYYRLAVVEIDLPPLRERAGDIQLLANEFLGRFCAAEREEDHRVRRRGVGVDHELPLAGQRARAEERRGARGDHEPATRRSVRSDIMPRHLRSGDGMPAALTIPVGATAAEARRQLVLRTFASTSGDAERDGEDARSLRARRALRAAAPVERRGGCNARGRAGRRPASRHPRHVRRGGRTLLPTPARAASKKPSAKKGR